jgi:hypothetical protein
MKLWLFMFLGFIAVGLGVLGCVIPSDGARFLGGCLVAFGAMNTLFYRRLGSQVFKEGRSMPPDIVRRFWEIGGERGTQLLYLGIGIILSTAGGVLIIRSLV